MTLDEHIHRAEEDAKKAQFDTEWGIGNYFIDRTEALEYAKECRQLAEWLKEFKQLKEQTRWIPVSEILPEVGSEVLVCFDFKGNRSVYISTFYGDGEFYGLDDEYLTSEGRKYRKAVAWMPLPEPYVPDTNDGKMGESEG